MRNWVCPAILAALLLLAPAAQGDTAAKLEDQLVIDADQSTQQKLYTTIRSRPPADNPALVPWLRAHLSKLQPFFAFELSRRLFDDDRDSALDWYYVGQLRMRYAAARCTDPTDYDGLAFALVAQVAAKNVTDYIQDHGQEALAAFRRATARRDLLDDDTAPAWACGHGMDAYGKALGLGKPPSQGPVKPPAEWPPIRQALLDGLPKEAAAMELSLKDKQADTAAAATRPHAVPAAILSGTRADKIGAIGAEALASVLLQSGDGPASIRASTLLMLAEAQIKSGDAVGARATVDASRRFILSKSQTGAGWEGRLAKLLVEIGERDKAASYVADLSDPGTRLWALGQEGVALVQAGDRAAARQVLDTLGQAAQPAHPPDKGGLVARPRDLAVKTLGSAFAGQQDIETALRAAGLLPDGLFRIQLLSDIAVAQCGADDKAAADTLNKAAAAVPQVEQGLRRQAAGALVYGLASCGQAGRAAELAANIMPDGQADILVDVARRLTQSGDYAHARDIDERVKISPDDVGGLAALGERQVARGDTERARQSLALASTQMLQQVQMASGDKRSPAPLPDMAISVGRIVPLQAKLGAYAEAIRTSKAVNANNRPQFLATIVSTAAENKDAAALNEVLPTILDAIGEALPGIADNAYARAGLALARAGFTAQARQVQARIAGHFVQLAELQAAIGDAAGARATVNGLAGDEASHAQGLFDVALSQSDFADAGAQTAKLAGNRRDGALARLSEREAKAGDLAGAMTTAWQIDELSMREGALVQLLKELPPEPTP